MKINPDVLFIGVFVICACSWIVYMFYVIKNITGTPFLRWHEVKMDRESNPEAKQVWEQGRKWMKICFITWVASFILLVLLIFGLDKFGLLAKQNVSSKSAPTATNPMAARR